MAEHAIAAVTGDTLNRIFSTRALATFAANVTRSFTGTNAGDL